LGSIKMRGISWLAAKTGQLLKKDSAPWSNHYRNGRTDNCILRWVKNRISHHIPSNCIMTRPVHYINYIILSINFKLP
jgi:hypothetical protein